VNDLILVCLIIFIIARVIGLAVSLDFYYDTRKKKFKIFGIGWVWWILAAFMPIYSTLVKDPRLIELLLVLNILFASLGAIFYGWGIFKYFLEVPVKVMVALIIISIAVPLILFLTISYTAAVIFSVIIFNSIFFSAYIVPPLKKKNFTKFIGKSIRWYFAPILIAFIYIGAALISYSQGYSYGLYESDDAFLIVITYVPAIVTTLLLIILLVHLEYTLSNREKFDLKDKYSHELGNIMQAIFTTFDLIKTKREPKKEVAELEALLETKLNDASNLIKEIRKL